MIETGFEEWMRRTAGTPDFKRECFDDIVSKNKQLLTAIKARLPELESMLEEICSHWEDPLYRFYHHSFKVYALQDTTRNIVETLYALAPEGTTINTCFQEILADGMSGKQFELDHNSEWTRHTRPIVEAFFHARFFLEMAVKYGRELDEAPNRLPSGWAALLYLYNIR